MEFFWWEFVFSKGLVVGVRARLSSGFRFVGFRLAGMRLYFLSVLGLLVVVISLGLIVGKLMGFF